MGRRNACHCASHVATQGLAWLLGVEGSVWKRLHEDAIWWEGSVIMGALTRSRSLRWSHRLRKYFHLPSMLLVLIMSSLFLTSFSKLHLWITSVTQPSVVPSNTTSAPLWSLAAGCCGWPQPLSSTTVLVFGLSLVFSWCHTGTTQVSSLSKSYMLVLWSAWGLLCNQSLVSLHLKKDAPNHVVFHPASASIVLFSKPSYLKPPSGFMK